MEGATMAPDSSTGAGLAARVRHWLVEPLFSVLFPPRCAGCGDFETYLCDSCRSTLEPIGLDGCPRCGEPGPRALLRGRCARCLDKSVSYAAARGAFRHEGPARRLVAEFKFGGQPVLGRIMGELAYPAFSGLLSSLASPDRLAVTWVPCHRSAQRERGYNQAEVLARALVGSCPPETRPAGPVALVRKTRATRHQKGLTRTGRQSNLRGAFDLVAGAEARLGSQVQGIVLVDDVYTTGATSGEVATVLSEGTRLPVYVFTFSRAVVSGSDRHD